MKWADRKCENCCYSIIELKDGHVNAYWCKRYPSNGNLAQPDHKCGNHTTEEEWDKWRETIDILSDCSIHVVKEVLTTMLSMHIQDKEDNNAV